MAQLSRTARVGSLRAVLVLAGGLAACAGSADNDTFFCRVSCAGNFTSGCHAGECPKPPKGCTLFALQPFVDKEVCSEFLQSDPVCNGVTQQCPEAANFQLVYDRNSDIQRTYKLREWDAVADTFFHDGVAFSPGGTHFIMGRKEIGVAVEAFHNSSKITGVVSKVAEVMTADGPVGQIVHATGTWAPESASSLNQEGARYFARWVEVKDEHWVMDTLIMALPTASSLGESLVGAHGIAYNANKWATDDAFAAIRARQSQFTSLYNSKNYTGLVAEMYSERSAILPADNGKLVPKALAEAYFKGLPLGAEANVYPTIVTSSPDGLVAHEVGFSGSTKTGYYARWARADKGKDWVLESHCFGVFPKVPVADAVQLVV